MTETVIPVMETVIYAVNTTNGAASLTVPYGITTNGSSYTANGEVTQFGNLTFNAFGDLIFAGVYPGPGAGLEGVQLYALTNNAGVLATNPTPLADFNFLCDGGFVMDSQSQLFLSTAMLQQMPFQIFRYSFITYYRELDGTNKLVRTDWNYDYSAFLGYPWGRNMTMDNAGNLFLATGSSVFEFTNVMVDAQRPCDNSFGEIPYVAGYGDYILTCVAFDHSGNLFAGYYNDLSYEGYIYEFTNVWTGNMTPFASGLGIVTALGFDAAGNLFEAESDTGNLNEFINTDGYLSSTPVTFATGLCAPQALAFVPPAGSIKPQIHYTSDSKTPQINIANMSLSTPASLVISWPSSMANDTYVVQTNGDLTTTNWANFGGPVNSYQGTNYVTIPQNAGSLFFRMIHP